MKLDEQTQLIRDEITYFAELIKTPNLDDKTIATVNQTLRYLINGYLLPKITYLEIK